MNQLTKNSRIPVYKDNIAQQLIEENYQLLTTRPNGKYPGRRVYYFKNVPGLQKRIDQLVNQLKRGLLKDEYK